MKKILSNTVLLTTAVAFLLSGCSATKKMSNEQKGAAIGAGAGAIIGGILGNNIGKKSNTAAGVTVGAILGGVAGGIIGNKMDRQAEKIKTELPGAEVERVNEGIDVVFSDKNPDGSKVGVYFATNKFDLSPNAILALDRMIKIFNEYPDTDILIAGHTDDVGTDNYNMTLSQKRADAVYNYLIKAGIAAGRLSAKAFGETQPRVENKDATSRSENRRVEFVITANEKMKADAVKEAQQK